MMGLFEERFIVLGINNMWGYLYFACNICRLLVHFYDYHFLNHSINWKKKILNARITVCFAYAFFVWCPHLQSHLTAKKQSFSDRDTTCCCSRIRIFCVRLRFFLRGHQ